MNERQDLTIATAALDGGFLSGPRQLILELERQVTALADLKADFQHPTRFWTFAGPHMAL